MGNTQQGNAIFIVGHDACHAFAGRRPFGLIKFRLTNRDGFCVLCLQQLGATQTSTLPLCGPGAQQKGDPAEGGSTREKWQPRSPRIE
jgi:hypothetical protein